MMYLANRFLNVSIGGLFSQKYVTAEWSWGKLIDFISHLWVPIIVIGVAGTAGLIRILRANLLDEISKSYVEMARAKGLRETVLIMKYPVRIAINPFISSIGWVLPGMISGDVIVSVVLGLPTAGPMFLQALRQQDMMLAGAYIMLISVCTVVGILLSDILLIRASGTTGRDAQVRYRKRRRLRGLATSTQATHEALAAPRASIPQWRLVWRKFRNSRLAVAGAIAIIICYLMAAFAEFCAPYDPRFRDVDHPAAPPMRVRLFADGRLQRPFVYGMVKTVNMETLTRTYAIDPERRHPLALFVRGDSYRLWNVWEGEIHLFGTADGGRAYLLGTDRDGRDLLSRILLGARLSLSIGLVGVALSFCFGIVLGSVSGYFGGAVDMVIQRFIEVLTSIPTLPLWMGLSAALPLRWPVVKVFFFISLILSLLGWPELARVVRGKFLSLREEDFITSAVLDGVTTRGVIFRHMLPSFMSHIIAAATLAVPSMILAETALSFLGIGLRAPAISWGVLLQDAQSVDSVVAMPWLFTPGLFVVVSVLAFNFFGDGLRDAADPYK